MNHPAGMENGYSVLEHWYMSHIALSHLHVRCPNAVDRMTKTLNSQRYAAHWIVSYCSYAAHWLFFLAFITAVFSLHCSPQLFRKLGYMNLRICLCLWCLFTYRKYITRQFNSSYSSPIILHHTSEPVRWVQQQFE